MFLREIYEKFKQSDHHTKEEVKEICREWLVQHIMDEWMCE